MVEESASSRFTPLLFWGAIVLVALAMASLSLRKTLTPLRGQVQPSLPQVIDHHSPRPAFRLFGPWYRTKNFDFTRARWTAKAQYNFENVQPGIYKVEASILPYAFLTQAPYTVKEGETVLATILIDQSAGAVPGTRPTEQWAVIATDLTINGPDLTVEVTSPATPGATTSVMARGVRLTMLSPFSLSSASSLPSSLSSSMSSVSSESSSQASLSSSSSVSSSSEPSGGGSSVGSCGQSESLTPSFLDQYRIEHTINGMTTPFPSYSSERWEDSGRRRNDRLLFERQQRIQNGEEPMATLCDPAQADTLHVVSFGDDTIPNFQKRLEIVVNTGQCTNLVLISNNYEWIVRTAGNSAIGEVAVFTSGSVTGVPSARVKTKLESGSFQWQCRTKNPLGCYAGRTAGSSNEFVDVAINELFTSSQELSMQSYQSSYDLMNNDRRSGFIVGYQDPSLMEEYWTIWMPQWWSMNVIHETEDYQWLSYGGTVHYGYSDRDCYRIICKIDVMPSPTNQEGAIVRQSKSDPSDRTYVKLPDDLMYIVPSVYSEERRQIVGLVLSEVDYKTHLITIDVDTLEIHVSPQLDVGFYDKNGGTNVNVNLLHIFFVRNNTMNVIYSDRTYQNRYFRTYDIESFNLITSRTIPMEFPSDMHFSRETNSFYTITTADIQGRFILSSLDADTFARKGTVQTLSSSLISPLIHWVDEGRSRLVVGGDPNSPSQTLKIFSTDGGTLTPIREFSTTNSAVYYRNIGNISGTNDYGKTYFFVDVLTGEEEVYDHNDCGTN
ncbi:MAG: hypothetical protein V1926_02965 [Candidatus Peregrinibacteria bacterium]